MPAARPRRRHRALAAALTALAAAVTACDESAPRDRSGGAPARRPAVRFTDVTAAAGVAQDKDSGMWGAAWGDYDRDLDPDLMLGRHFAHALLFENDGRRFRPAAGAGDVVDQFDRHGCAWGEANGDGRPDLYCTRGALEGTAAGPNYLAVQRGGRLLNEAKRRGARDKFGRGRSTNWLDFDGDGDLDLFVGNKRRPGHPDALLRNDGGRFRRVDWGLARGTSTISSSWSDWDRDGDPDLLALQYGDRAPIAYVNDGDRFRRAPLGVATARPWSSAAWGDFDGDGWTDVHLVGERGAVVARNRAGRFEVVHRMRLAQGRTSAWLDADNDADLDVVVAQGIPERLLPPDDAAIRVRDRPELLLRNDGGSFERVGGWSYRAALGGDTDSVSVADFDGDGRVDVLVTNGWAAANARATLLANRSRAQTWARVALSGPRANPWGYGARLVVRAGRMRYRREVTDGVTFRSQSDASLVHLGLAGARAARVRVEWPGGGADCVHVRAGATVRVRAGASPCARGGRRAGT
ncbi:MAG TPA: CRTAC1 family protein [Actinomycetota bacterium]|nr:CRTAC1 family protein [Actinomycetota bacterium]